MTDTEFKAPKSAPMRTDQRFRYTKTGPIGLQRDTMLQNELHHLVIISNFKYWTVFAHLVLFALFFKASTG
jgi:hypothetical protein